MICASRHHFITYSRIGNYLAITLSVKTQTKLNVVDTPTRHGLSRIDTRISQYMAMARDNAQSDTAVFKHGAVRSDSVPVSETCSGWLRSASLSLYLIRLLFDERAYLPRRQACRPRIPLRIYLFKIGRRRTNVPRAALYPVSP